MAKSRHSYTDEFREQVARLVTDGGRSQQQVARETGVSVGTVNSWVRKLSSTGSFRDEDLLTEEQRELKALRKEHAMLLMENDLLKQIAQLMGQK